MSVRKKKWRDAKGRLRSKWMIHVEYTDPQGCRRPPVRKVSPVQTKAGALRYEREVRQALLEGTYGKEMTIVPLVRVFAMDYLEHARLNTKHSSSRSTESILRVHLIPAFGGKRIDEISTRDVDRYKATKNHDGLKNKTINNHLACLSRMLTLAKDWGLRPDLPRIDLLTVPPPEDRSFTWEEAQQVLDAARAEPEWFAMVALAISTGLRQGELLALQWSDIDFDVALLMVRRSMVEGVVDTPKSGRHREIPLGEFPVRVLREWRLRQSVASSYVFCARDGGMRTDGQCKAPLYRVADRAGMKRFGWHKLRHTCASLVVSRGGQMKAVQDLLGHASMKTTQRYAHLAPVVLRNAVTRLDALDSTWTAHGSAANA